MQFICYRTWEVHKFSITPHLFDTVFYNMVIILCAFLLSGNTYLPCTIARYSGYNDKEMDWCGLYPHDTLLSLLLTRTLISYITGTAEMNKSRIIQKLGDVRTQFNFCHLLDLAFVVTIWLPLPQASYLSLKIPKHK